ncbi:DUF21-domain-containing protein [Punctularia strigosozonata HHB-11173 SS5]|uniref:DUF21-domain-containing protein n=1 Tax=Punctularia strigosozonata (strain HHB-11173) TaxID=741275 RepID=UPI0004417C01|nr:DUF21-domain-containing protein [Punctularia strigosozonata HHB-11173 SS5]EIN12939.1 DUF21-domain-containing protein [Punctularia strigosozonata HHB-11173 SS5]
MSLDETQLNVLSVSGTPKQQAYARKIQPIRKNGHLLLVTLLLANMVVNETLPVISDPVLGGGVQSVVVSTVLIVIFSEIIPQSVCTRYGLAVGAIMAPFTRVLIWTLGIVAWPVAKLLEFVLGSHHGIMYRRSELKELVNMHAATEAHGGDLKRDTVTIIGAALDLEEKTAKDAMTPIDSVFMLPLSAKLDHDTLHNVVSTGHSRIPVYDWVEVPMFTNDVEVRKEKVKKVIGILLVKNCVLLDPKDAKPLREMPLNRVVFVPQNELLLGILDKFQEGRSHIAVVTRFSKAVAASVKQEVKKGFSQRLKDKVGMTDSSDSDTTDDEDDTKDGKKSKENGQPHQLSVFGSGLEQNMPADAVLPRSGRNEITQSIEPGVMPLGIITLEDVLEELIGEEIYDEFDQEGVKPDYHFARPEKKPSKAPESTPNSEPGAKTNLSSPPASRRPSFRIPRSIKLTPSAPKKARSLPSSEEAAPAPADVSTTAPGSPQVGGSFTPAGRSASPMPMDVSEGGPAGNDTTEPGSQSPAIPTVVTPATAAPLGAVLHERAKYRQPSVTRTNAGGSPKIVGKGRLFKSVPIDGNASETTAQEPTEMVKTEALVDESKGEKHGPS